MVGKIVISLMYEKRHPFRCPNSASVESNYKGFRKLQMMPGNTILEKIQASLQISGFEKKPINVASREGSCRKNKTLASGMLTNSPFLQV